MPVFKSIDKIVDPIPGFTHRGMAPGDYTTVSEDEAAILRELPHLFTEILPEALAEVLTEEAKPTWTGKAPKNRMIGAADIRKGADEGAAEAEE